MKIQLIDVTHTILPNDFGSMTLVCTHIVLFCKIALPTITALEKYGKLSNVEKSFSPYEAESQLKTLLSIFV